MDHEPREIQRLKTIPIFKDLEAQQLADVVQASQSRNIDAEKFLFMQGDEADAFYLLLEGSVKLTQVTLDGQEIILRYASPGEAFGLIAFLAEQTYPVSAFTVNNSQVRVWYQSEVHALMNRIPTIATNALQIMSRHVREFQDRIRELSTERVERRIARALLRLARQMGKKAPEGVYLNLPISHQDLAELTGTTLYTVSRTFSKWETMGLIKTGREQVLIRVPHGLVSIADDLQGRDDGGGQVQAP